jgi:tetratricopeptide (TPR) repeat protein
MRRSRIRRRCVVSRRFFRRVPVKRLVRALLAASLLIAAFLGTRARASAQTAGTSNLMSSPAGWPSTGAASGFTGVALDPLAIYVNPAGLAAQDERSLFVHHGMLQFSTTWDLAAVSYPVPGLGGVGLGFARIGTGGIEGYDSQNRPVGTITYRETAAAASIARRVRGPIWAGVTFKILGQSLGDVSASAPALDLGILYRPLVLRGGQIGVSAQNVVAGSLDLGGASPPLDHSYRIGLGGPEWRLNAVTSGRVVLDLATRGKEGMKPRVGAEFSRAGLGAVRAGYSDGGPVLGLGLRFRRYGFDYAYQSGKVEATQQFALRFAWGVPVSRYEASRIEELRRAAEDSLRARHAGDIARDRAKAEAAEKSGDWETALVLWQVLERSDPGPRGYASRAENARAEIERSAKAAIDAEGGRRIALVLADMARKALARGDAEEAAGLMRGIQSAGDAGGVSRDTLATLVRDVAAARDRVAVRALARADSLQGKGRTVDAAGQVALALRLRPDDPKARARWSEMEAALGKSAAEAQSLSRKLAALTTLNEVARAFAEGRYTDANVAVQRALALDPGSPEAKDWRDRVERRLSTPKPELDARIKQLYIKGMEAFSGGDYREALRNWEQILVLDPLNESARRNVLEARERMKSEARR